jgi:hypothetical protein
MASEGLLEAEGASLFREWKMQGNSGLTHLLNTGACLGSGCILAGTFEVLAATSFGDNLEPRQVTRLQFRPASTIRKYTVQRCQLVRCLGSLWVCQKFKRL